MFSLVGLIHSYVESYPNLSYCITIRSTNFLKRAEKNINHMVLPIFSDKYSVLKNDTATMLCAYLVQM